MVTSPPKGVKRDPNDPSTTMDDDYTNFLAQSISSKLNCSALINEKVPRNTCDYNRIDGAGKDTEFMKDLKTIIVSEGPTIIFWIHGIEEQSRKEEIKEMGLDPGHPLDCLIGYGQADGNNQDKRFTAKEDTVKSFIQAFKKQGITAMPSRNDAKNYRGWDSNNMNQWFRQQGNSYPLD
jgi:hypothetical protein